MQEVFVSQASGMPLEFPATPQRKSKEKNLVDTYDLGRICLSPAFLCVSVPLWLMVFLLESVRFNPAQSSDSAVLRLVFAAHPALVAHVVKCGEDAAVIDFTCAGFKAPRVVG